MSKRTLLIIIALLAIIDLVAAGWYVAQRLEHSGKGQNIFERRDSTALQADTLIEATTADVYGKPILKSAYFISNQPAIAGNQMSYYTSIKHLKMRIPQEVNSNDSLIDLNDKIASVAFGGSHSLDEATRVYLNAPVFNKPVGSGYRSIKASPNIYQGYANVHQVLIYPSIVSQRLLVMQVDKVEFNGYNNVRTTSFVHYDRINQQVLDNTDILKAGNDNKLLTLLNEKIDYLNGKRAQDNQLQHAINVPSQMCCAREGILFEFPVGTLSKGSPIQVLLDYDKLQSFLTDNFKRIKQSDGGYHNYDKLQPIAVKPRTDFKPARTKAKVQSGVTRKPARRSRVARRHWSRRQR